jgi:hypothetical protein
MISLVVVKDLISVLKDGFDDAMLPTSIGEVAHGVAAHQRRPGSWLVPVTDLGQ